MKKIISALAFVIFVLSVTAVSVGAVQKVDVCHRLGNGNWKKINVSYFYGWINGHSKHSDDFLVTDVFPCPPRSPQLIEFPIEGVIPEEEITDEQLSACNIFYDTCEGSSCDPITFRSLEGDTFFERYHRFCLIYFRLSNGNGFYATTDFRYGGYEVRGIHTKTAGVVRTLSTPEIVLVDWYIKRYDFDWLPVILRQE